MKVLVDTNVLLSYLLAPTTPRAVTRVVTTCVSHDEIGLLVPREQIAELAAKASSKRYFRTRIPHAAIERFVAELTALGELLPPPEVILPYSRDPKDDYLVAYAIVNEADSLITGDADLLVLGRVGSLEVLTPARFLALLRAHHFLP